MEITLRISLVGDSGVGKTSLVYSFMNNEIPNISIPVTIGVEYNSKNIKINSEDIKLNIWDTAGLERFRSITRAYYKKSNIFLIVYDVTDRKTFDNLKYWYDEIIKLSGKSILISLIGNKSDLPIREVSYLEGKNFAKNRDIFFDEINISEIYKINLILHNMCHHYINKFNLEKDTKSIVLSKKNPKKYCCFLN